MAEVQQIAELRRATGIMDEGDPYTDVYLSELIDTMGFELAAAQLWTEKAATFAGMVDTTESGSSRKMSQLADNALKLAKSFADTGSARSRSFTVPIERP